MGAKTGHGRYHDPWRLSWIGVSHLNLGFTVLEWITDGFTVRGMNHDPVMIIVTPIWQAWSTRGFTIRGWCYSPWSPWWTYTWNFASNPLLSKTTYAKFNPSSSHNHSITRQFSTFVLLFNLNHSNTTTSYQIQAYPHVNDFTSSLSTI